ncbi:MAG TPA: hypothetical protein VD999_02235 [Vitreimonas sp.]|nr:hypothetical protein [Vitreimonas sp.]
MSKYTIENVLEHLNSFEKQSERNWYHTFLMELSFKIAYLRPLTTTKSDEYLEREEELKQDLVKRVEYFSSNTKAYEFAKSLVECLGTNDPELRIFQATMTKLIPQFRTTLGLTLLTQAEAEAKAAQIKA